MSRRFITRTIRNPRNATFSVPISNKIYPNAVSASSYSSSSHHQGGGSSSSNEGTQPESYLADDDYDTDIQWLLDEHQSPAHLPNHQKQRYNQYLNQKKQEIERLPSFGWSDQEKEEMSEEERNSTNDMESRFDELKTATNLSLRLEEAPMHETPSAGHEIQIENLTQRHENPDKEQNMKKTRKNKRRKGKNKKK